MGKTSSICRGRQPGERGSCRVLGGIAVAAISACAPEKALERSEVIDAAALGWQQEALARLYELPLLQEGKGVSAVFWVVGDSIAGPRSWSDAYASGADLISREFLPDSEWQVAACAHYDLPLELARLAITIARRGTARVPIVDFSESELRLLVPRDAPHQHEALDLIVSDGIFGVPTA